VGRRYMGLIKKIKALFAIFVLLPVCLKDFIYLREREHKRERSRGRRTSRLHTEHRAQCGA